MRRKNRMDKGGGIIMKNAYELQGKTFEETMSNVRKESINAHDYHDWIQDIQYDYERWTEDLRLGFDLHAMFGDFDDGWLYEIHNGRHDWSASCHSKWHRKACQLIKKTGDMNIKTEDLTKLFKLIKD